MISITTVSTTDEFGGGDEVTVVSLVSFIRFFYQSLLLAHRILSLH
jgi:hypothetical protein